MSVRRTSACPSLLTAALLVSLGMLAPGCRRASGGRDPWADDGPAITFPQPAVEPHLAGHFETRRNFLPPRQNGEQVIAIGDCDGDGLGDLVREDGSVWRGLGDGTFQEVGRPDDWRGGAALAATLGDVDGDGNADLVLANHDALLFAGDGTCHFPHGNTVLTGDPQVWIAQVRAADVDQDGLADLSIALRGSPTTAVRLLLARGDGAFEEVPLDQTPWSRDRVDQRGLLGFGTFFHDVDGDGVLDLFAVVDFGAAWFSWGVPGDAPRFVRDERVSRLASSIDSMSVTPIDVDRDGRRDYFISGTVTSRLLWNRGPRDLVNLGAQANAMHHGKDFDWGAYSFDADRDGWRDLLLLRKTGDEHAAPTGLLLNRHDVTFTDAGPDTIGESFSAHALACGDLRGQGLPDCIVNDDAGAALLLNRLEPQGNWLGVRLVGSVSARVPESAEISLDGEERPLTVTYGGQSPTFATHLPGQIFALGARAQASVQVTWPSGLVTRHGGLAANGWVRVEEPEVLRVSRRVAPADGHSEVEVVVDPKPVDAKAVSIECAGDGTWTGPMQAQDEGTWKRVLVAPKHAGACRIEVSLDGKPLQVRPRVRWE